MGPAVGLICPGWNGHTHKMFIAQGGWREGQIEKINGDVTNNLGNTFTAYLSLLANLHFCIQFIPCWSFRLSKLKVYKYQFWIPEMSDAKIKWAAHYFFALGTSSPGVCYNIVVANIWCLVGHFYNVESLFGRQNFRLLSGFQSKT